MTTAIRDEVECKRTILAVHDAMEVLQGKWKLPLIAAISSGHCSYAELLRSVKGISGKMLSRELKQLEQHHIITRTVLDTRPLSVEYRLTEYGEKINPVIQSLANWGFEHRKMVFGKP